MNTPQLISLVSGISALENRGDGIGRPMDERTQGAIGAFRNAMLRRLITCHLSGAAISIDTESLITLNDTLLALETEGDGFLVGLSQEDKRLSAELRAALIERVRLHPGGNAIAKLMSRLSPAPVVEPPRPVPAVAPQPEPTSAVPAGTSVAVVPSSPDAGFVLADDGALVYEPDADAPAENASGPRMPAAA